MKLIPFELEHLDRIQPQAAQATELLVKGVTSKEYTQNLLSTGPAITGISGDEVVFIIGKSEQWPGRHIIWSVMSKNAGKFMFGIVKSIKRLVDTAIGDGRIEVIVRADFPEGCRLVEKFFDFKFHHYEEKFLPDGSDALIYVRFM